MFSRKLCGVVAGAVVLTGIMVAAAPAGAADAEAQNCATYVSRGTTECFATFTEAVRVATAGEVTDAPATAAEAVRDEDLMVRLGAGDKLARPGTTIPHQLLIGLEFDGTSYNGDSKLFYDNEACTGPTSNVDHEVADLGSWNDRISSFMNFNNCYTKHYSLANFGGLTHDYANDMPVMPSGNGLDLNNKSRSIRWS